MYTVTCHCCFDYLQEHAWQLKEEAVPFTLKQSCTAVSEIKNSKVLASLYSYSSRKSCDQKPSLPHQQTQLLVSPDLFLLLIREHLKCVKDKSYC